MAHGSAVDEAVAESRATTDADRTPVPYGQRERLTVIDRFGVWLSARRVHREVRSFDGVRLGDFGCGFDARIARSLLPRVASATLVDVALADDLKADPRVTTIEGLLPAALAGIDDASMDVALCLSVLEHLDEPLDTLRELRRLLAPGGMCLVNVPNWRGKRYLELSAFRLGLGSDLVDEHKTYYDPKDLWPLLVHAGYLPSEIRCFRHKFGLNTFAVCGPSRIRARSRAA